MPRTAGLSRAARGAHERAPWRMPGGAIGKVTSLLQFDWDAASSHQIDKSLTCGFAAGRDTPTRRRRLDRSKLDSFDVGAG